VCFVGKIENEVKNDRLKAWYQRTCGVRKMQTFLYESAYKKRIKRTGNKKCTEFAK